MEHGTGNRELDNPQKRIATGRSSGLQAAEFGANNPYGLSRGPFRHRRAAKGEQNLWTLVPEDAYEPHHPNRARLTVWRKSLPVISIRMHISARRDLMRSPMRSPRVNSRAARSASVSSPPAGGKSG